MKGTSVRAVGWEESRRGAFLRGIEIIVSVSRSHLVVVVEVADVALLGGGEDEARGEYGDLEESHGGMTRRSEGGEEVAKTAWDCDRFVEWPHPT